MYCQRCADAKLPCAEGKPGINGEFCPYHENKLETPAGWQTWDIVLRCVGQARLLVAGDRVITTGLDFAAAIAMADGLGYDVPAICDMLPAAEAGMIVGRNR